jgi:hypothetical protein
VVSDAYPVQTLFLGLMDNVFQGQIAARRNIAVDVEIEKHSKGILQSGQIETTSYPFIQEKTNRK